MLGRNMENWTWREVRRWRSTAQGCTARRAPVMLCSVVTAGFQKGGMGEPCFGGSPVSVGNLPAVAEF